MWRCSDPILNYLEPLGYCVVRLPRADIRPLELLSARGRDLDRLGALATVLTIPDPGRLPQVSADQPVASIAGRRTGDLKLKMGLGLLGSIIGAMGGSLLGLESAYERAAALAFEFVDVFEDRVEVTSLDQVLAIAGLDPRSRHLRTLFNADGIYVTIATLKSKSIRVCGKRSDGSALEVSVPQIQALVGAKVGVSRQAGQEFVLQYQGEVPLVFGFQAIRLFYTDGRYTAFEPAATDMAIRGPRASAQCPTLLRSDTSALRLRNGW